MKISFINIIIFLANVLHIYYYYKKNYINNVKNIKIFSIKISYILQFHNAKYLQRDFQHILSKTKKLDQKPNFSNFNKEKQDFLILKEIY